MSVAAADIVMQALTEANSVLAPDKQIATEPGTPLLGGSGVDSLSLVTLLMAIEDRVEEALDVEVSLTEELGENAAAFATNPPMLLPTMTTGPSCC